ncbi:DUF305 domain-containing protein [Gordonia aurantiaca]|uniref:DUF305 domain-containing protein n=1 Tax=Gordonia sp. B21 TaxID=3151852 RepID=UPI003267AEE3
MSIQNTARSRRRAARLGIGAAAFGLAVTVVACSPDQEPSDQSGDGSPAAGGASTTTAASSALTPTSVTSPDTPAAHNEADIAFNSMMIVHHQQAVEMADLVEDRTTNAELIALADRIEDAQEAEIDQMTDRLRSWGVAVPDDDHNGHMQHGPHSGAMGGMMSAQEMTTLQNARGAEFDRLWLEGMIRHHEGAIEMADEELADGVNPASKELATQVRQTQRSEIDQMRKMLGR